MYIYLETTQQKGLSIRDQFSILKKSKNFSVLPIGENRWFKIMSHITPSNNEAIEVVEQLNKNFKRVIDIDQNQTYASSFDEYIHAYQIDSEKK
jgi:hypothetical protein